MKDTVCRRSCVRSRSNMVGTFGQAVIGLASMLNRTRRRLDQVGARPQSVLDAMQMPSTSRRSIARNIAPALP